jgi:hypothetical protein
VRRAIPFDDEHDATEAERVRWRLSQFGADSYRAVEFRPFNPSLTVWGPHHRDVHAHGIQAVDAVDPIALDWRLAFQLQPETSSSCRAEATRDYAQVLAKVPALFGSCSIVSTHCTAAW